MKFKALRLIAAGAFLTMTGCSSMGDSIWPSLAGEEPAHKAANKAKAAKVNATRQVAAATAPVGGPPALAASNIELPQLSTLRPTGTIVGQKVTQIGQELRALAGRLNQRNAELSNIRNSTINNAQRYHGTVAAVQAKLQLGSTPGNPVLIQQWNQAQTELDRLSQDVAAMNQLTNGVASDASMAGFLLESARATYGISGAVDEDHRQLALLEDETNKTVVVIDRLLQELSDDVSRQTAYIGNERRNLGSLALAIKNGELYGTSLSSRAFSPANVAGLQPNRPAARGAGVAATRPLVVIRFDRPNVQYEQALYTAVSRALERRPDARFDLIAVSPNTGSPADIALLRSDSRRKADNVMRTLAGMGLPSDRMALSSTTSPNARASEVHIYVR